MEIINLTPHDVNLVKEDNGEIVEVMTFTPCGKIARCSQTIEKIGDVEIGVEIDTGFLARVPIPITKNTYGEIVDLPEPSRDYIYIVSALVANAATDRYDLVIPNELVRDENGNIVGCKSLAKVR